VGAGEPLPLSRCSAPAEHLMVTRPAAAVDAEETFPCATNPEPDHMRLQLIPVLLGTADVIGRYDASRPQAAECCVTKAPVAAETAGVAVAVVPSVPSALSQQVAGALKCRCDDVRIPLTCQLIQVTSLTWDPAGRLLRLVTVEHAPATAAAVPRQEPLPVNRVETPLQS